MSPTDIILLSLASSLVLSVCLSVCQYQFVHILSSLVCLSVSVCPCPYSSVSTSVSMYNITANETQPTSWLHLNGTPDQILDRLCVSELVKGWPVYRDASEWRNFRDCFARNAYVFTSNHPHTSKDTVTQANSSITAWTGGTPIDTFITESQKSRASGDFIQHRETGTEVDLSSTTTRAIAKMKATITQRFEAPDPNPDNNKTIEYDIDCDVRFIAFCQKQALPVTATSPMPGTGLGPRSGSAGWRIQYIKLFYEKDRVVPVDGRNAPVFQPSELEAYPYGYRMLGAAQARRGRKVRLDLPTLQDDEHFWGLRRAMDGWLNGEDVREALGL